MQLELVEYPRNLYCIRYKNEWITPFALLIFQVDHVLGPLELSITLAILFVVFAYLYMFCELGEKVSKQFEMFDDALSQCNWYAFPLKIQRILIIFMANSQDPAFLRGYGNILCTRETFKKVIRSFVLCLSTFFSGLTHSPSPCPTLDHQCELFVFHDVAPNQWIKCNILQVCQKCHSQSYCSLICFLCWQKY